MNWMVREVSGAWLLAKNAPVRALATAPSMANVSRSVLPVIAGVTPPSTRTPRMRPLRSTMAMMASLLRRGRRRPVEQLLPHVVLRAIRSADCAVDATAADADRQPLRSHLGGRVRRRGVVGFSAHHVAAR